MRDHGSWLAWLRRFVHRLGSPFRSRRVEVEMAEEMRLHIELLAREHAEAGAPPDEAWATARREFGHLDGISETCRDQRGFLWISQLGQDLRYGLRMLRRAPGFTGAAVLTLALGIGVNTGILSLADDILLRQLPVRRPDELVLFHWGARQDFPVPVGGSWEEDPRTHVWMCTSFSRSVFEQFQAPDGPLSGLMAFAPVSALTLAADGGAESIPLGELVSGDGFRVLGVAPAAGRPLVNDDDTAASPPVAMLSFAYWQRRFGGDPTVVGRSVVVNSMPLTIVGVAPRGFVGTLQVGDTPDLFLPMALAGRLGVRGAEAKSGPDKVWWLQLMGRLKPGVTAAQAQSRLGVILQRCARLSLAATGASSPAVSADLPALAVGPGGQGLSEIRHQYFRQWAILAGLGATVLAIACANMANLLLARGAARRREIGVRLAMGAGRGRVARQLLTESVLLAGLGGVLAIPCAMGVQHALLALQPKLEGHALALEVHVDLQVFALAALLSLLTGLVFGLVPAWRATRVNINAEFQGGSHNRGGSPSRLGRALLVVQVALSLVLLVGAGLFSRTLRNLRHVDIGFERGNLLLFELDPNPAGADFEAAALKNRRMAARLRALPGVLAVTFSKIPLLAGQGWNTRLKVPGRPASGGQDSAMLNAVGADFFATYGIPVVRGRGLMDRDERRSTVVAVINQAMAQAFFGEADPVGRVIEPTDLSDPPAPIEIVGVVRDTRYSAVRDAAPPTLYLPFSASRTLPSAAATFAVRTTARPALLVPAVREAVRSVDPLVPLADLRTQASQIEDLSANERMFAWLSGLFSVLSLGLIAVGLYGLMAYQVQRRTGEIGLRMALGAPPATVIRMVLRECAWVAGAGVALGLAGSYAATRVVTSLLYGLSPTDPATFATGAAVLLGIALLAGWAPARRAARIDPMVALRTE